ncbi:GGDEF domain-containing protein [Aquamicrobium sp. NLF2-7]|uniref:GGDEF domain-containing protein n=1 Tax=Aquamicrobium sp. NLF2-7 TaxID=2918753 RepID=UPI001EFB48B7|nr:GGDEF domain-containing protein [Aquamicrobium sp. NLF2-7]MCG8273335.1 GGDEF domain-containing protein [Aquamicrobium sp. NLF2-7]
MTYKITLEEHQATIRSLPVAACLVDKQLIYLSVSDRYADLFGATVDQLIGRSMVGIVPDSVISGFQGDFEALENGLETATDELVIDGRMYLATIHPLRHETGAMIATFVTLTDISAFKRRIADLSGKFEKLQSFTSKLQELAETDALTSLPNRRGMERFVCTEMRRCRREEKPLSVALIDIDYFKQFNDRFGHLAGDCALNLVGKVIQQSIRRPGDCVARYGGEEFIVILPDTNLAGAQHVCDTIQRAISARAITYESHPCEKLTVSIGIAGVSRIPRDIDLTVLRETLLREADLALYDAKGAGRNNVRVWQKQIGAA